LLALRPKVLTHLRHVFALPLGILAALGADFDGDQVSVVALESAGAVREAHSMLPGAFGLRLDPFRSEMPAFPLLHELSCPKEELLLAQLGEIEQAAWAEKHAALLRGRLDRVGDGWSFAAAELDKQQDYWRGLEQDEWLKRAPSEMEKVYAVRAKGRLGGVLRRQLYLRDFTDWPAFAHSVGAIQAVTERLTQSALSVKTSRITPPSVDSRADAGGQTPQPSGSFQETEFFRKPTEQYRLLANLDSSFDYETIATRLGDPTKPVGLLRWLAKPDLETLVEVFTKASAISSLADPADPRVGWFLA
jgi:hypothetical protein